MLLEDGFEREARQGHMVRQTRCRARNGCEEWVPKPHAGGRSLERMFGGLVPSGRGLNNLLRRRAAHLP